MSDKIYSYKLNLYWIIN